MDKAYIYMQMDKNIMANFFREKSMDVGNTLIKVELYMMDNGIKIRRMDLGFILIQISKSIKVIG
jgi:hypothetical protein